MVDQFHTATVDQSQNGGFKWFSIDRVGSHGLGPSRTVAGGPPSRIGTGAVWFSIDRVGSEGSARRGRSREVRPLRIGTGAVGSHHYDSFRYTPITTPRRFTLRKSRLRTTMGSMCELAGWKRIVSPSG